MKCKNCLRTKLKKIVFLGKQPISSIFYNSKRHNIRKYPLDLYICKICKLVQLGQVAPLNKMYGTNYGYQSGISNLMVKHLQNKFEFLKKKGFLKKKINILDIGSNDGTFLNFFSKKNLITGVDPSIGKFKHNYKANIKKIDNFFSKKIIDKYFKRKKKFDLITSFAIFYDVEKPNSFCKDIESLLSDKGIWILEFSYLPLMLKNLTYDQICHEHVTYYSLTVFKRIAEQNALKILKIKFNEINGGSIEVICAKKESNFKIDKKLILRTLEDEKKINKNSYLRFNKRILKIKNDLNLFFKKNKNKKIIGYGASTKGNIVLNQCEVSNKNLPFICDANKFKHNKYTPGTNIKIISKEKMRKLQPDFLLVLIWPFRKEVINQEIEYIKKGGCLIFLLPRFHVVNKKNYTKFYKQSFKSLSYNY